MWSNCRIYNVWLGENKNSENKCKDKLQTGLRNVDIISDIKHITK